MKLSDAEWQIMNALWKKHPATARELMEQMPADNDWAYTTVKTMLTRLISKDAVSEHKRGNTSVYEPLVSQQKARSSALKSLFEKALDGALEPVMHYLVEERKLSEKERRKLIQILEAMDKPGEEEENEPH
ncbi:MAG TPA: BlaI/MecI/CopY family transcriptional regulator [bacterium]|nr:BlaI/MecI/CopY family transcriptional regulator [bacterium]HPN45584.1 BlaI/MecI/CopY family transcriptional regulator [bacterium]